MEKYCERLGSIANSCDVDPTQLESLKMGALALLYIMSIHHVDEFEKFVRMSDNTLSEDELMHLRRLNIISDENID